MGEAQGTWELMLRELQLQDFIEAFQQREIRSLQALQVFERGLIRTHIILIIYHYLIRICIYNILHFVCWRQVGALNP